MGPIWVPCVVPMFAGANQSVASAYIQEVGIGVTPRVIILYKSTTSKLHSPIVLIVVTLGMNILG